mmetsp:Transcript_10346/g.14832  ORF Transcript_10346/g.14832 Transcript_10346/m.14832 type:complete len:229 (-) Transcript_10346:118-804(-)
MTCYTKLGGFLTESWSYPNLLLPKRHSNETMLFVYHLNNGSIHPLNLIKTIDSTLPLLNIHPLSRIMRDAMSRNLFSQGRTANQSATTDLSFNTHFLLLQHYKRHLNHIHIWRQGCWFWEDLVKNITRVAALMASTTTTTTTPTSTISEPRSLLARSMGFLFHRTPNKVESGIDSSTRVPEPCRILWCWVSLGVRSRECTTTVPPSLIHAMSTSNRVDEWSMYKERPL